MKRIKHRCYVRFLCFRFSFENPFYLFLRGSYRYCDRCKRYHY